MGRVDKGINCSVDSCGNQAERSMSGIKASMAPDLGLGGSKRVYLCRDHYKEWKKLRLGYATAAAPFRFY